MDFKFKGMKWVGDICQKFEEVCQEVDDIVGQDAVKYLEDQVQNVGDSVKRFYSDVVQEVLPRPPSVNSVKHGELSLALSNDIDSPLESVADFSEHKERVEENPVNNAIESFHNSDANNLPSNHHAQASIGHDLVNDVYDEIFSNSCEVADSCDTGGEIGDDYSRETSVIIKNSLNTSLEQNAVELTHEQFNVMSLNDKEPVESSTFSESIDSLTSSEVASSAMPSESSCLSESESLSARSQGRYCSEIDSCMENSVDVAGHSLDGSMVLVSCTAIPDIGVAGEFMTSQAGLLSCGSIESMESNDERPVNSIESDMEDIELSDNIKLGESCIFVDDMELHATSSRVRRLRSYKERIKDAFVRRKQLVKEYEQLAIWYGDSDMEISERTSQSSTTYLHSKNLQMQQNLSETEWELL